MNTPPIHNRITSGCGLCLAILCLAIAAPATAKDESSQYTTDQILAYLQSKAFGWTAAVPNAKGSVGARHSLWTTGAPDTVADFVFSDRSNTRLEAKIEIPLFDLSYLRGRDKEKTEFRTFVIDALSQILAAQTTVNILDSRIKTVQQRHSYTKTQVDLRLANRTDLFNIEDNLTTIQIQRTEAQSTLERRIIKLAGAAGNDWLEAYWMIIKWDGVLIAKETGKKK